MKNSIGQSGQPLICASLVAGSQDEILLELAGILAKQPDIIEWRADFFAQISQPAKVLALAETIKQTAGNIPAIFTIRSECEGGQPIPLSAEQIVELNMSICRNTSIEYVDCELCNKADHLGSLKTVAEATGTKIIGSFHNFVFTPGREVLVEKFVQAAEYRLDVAKVAVMPQCLEDVLTLLGATLEAKTKISIPVIAISMGKYGAVSRIIGGVFGSALTFGVGSHASAPGQLPIEDLKTTLPIITKAMGA